MGKQRNRLLVGTPKIALVVGTFAAVPYVHLHLEARRRLYPDIGMLVHGSSPLVSYSYLGKGAIVQTYAAQPSLTMTFIKQGSEPVGDAGGQYTGLDRFGRLVDSRWINGSGADIDRVEFGYSPASNRLWRQNIVAATGVEKGVNS
jgi:hypothetical protein